MASAALFDSFNARSLEPTQVGKGFIYSRFFREVIERSNTAIIGPRGSGKTTLLKMLTLPALANWKDSRAREITAALDYVAIYVPADFTWYPDFRRPVQGQSDEALDKLLTYGLFRSHVLLALCDTIDYMVDVGSQSKGWLKKFGLPADEVKLNRFTQLLAKHWMLDLPRAGMAALRSGVSDIIRRIQYLITLSGLRPLDTYALLAENAFLANAFTDDLRIFADAIDAEYGQGHRWAACFDEIEIAPDSVKLQIWQSTRSFDQRFVVKLSASPFDEEVRRLFGPKMPTPGHDYKAIYLTDQRQQEVKRFSQQLFKAMCAEMKLPSQRPEDILGASSFIDDDKAGLYSASEGQGDPYGPRGTHFRRFTRLAEKDQSFSEYLQGRGVNIANWAALPERIRAAEIRKHISTVAVRDEFFFERLSHDIRRDERKRRYRAKKGVSEIYTGAEAVFTICEGNPRWLIGLLKPLLREWDAETGNGLRISRREQAHRVERVITSFLALISTVPITSEAGDGASLVDLIDEIGGFFSDEVLGERFRPEPILSFTLDSGVSVEIRNAIGRGVNQGAFVVIPEKEKPQEAGVIDARRIRLTHLLAPLYRLPLVLGRRTSLSGLLTSGEKRSRDNSILLDLFSDFGND